MIKSNLVLSATNETITRDGGCPVYLAYITNYCIIDEAAETKITREDYPEALQNLAPRITGTPGPQDIKIPVWQRRLVWDTEKIDGLVNSESSMFGTVIIAKGESQSDTWTLIDGLQRFSSGTALIHALYDLVLSPTPSRQTEAPFFTTLKNTLGVKSAVIEWNHKRLSQLGKRGVRSSYNSLYTDIEKYVNQQLDKNPEEFAKALIRTFLIRQVAVDPYSGFGPEIELIRTFFSINSTGEALSSVDLLRAKILGHLESKGLEANVLDEIENDFTETLQKGRGNRYFTDLGINMYNIMYTAKDTAQLGTAQSGTTIRGNDPAYIFPNWNNIQKKDFDEFFTYHIAMADIPKITKVEGNRPEYAWPYLAEIFPYKLPYIMATMFYYKNHYLKYLKIRDDYIENKKIEFQAEEMKIPQAELRNRITTGAEINFVVSQAKAQKEIQEVIGNHQKVVMLQKKLLDLAEVKSTDPEDIQHCKDEIEEFETVEAQYPELLIELPDFLGGTLDTQQDLKIFYRAVMRKVLDGNIGKTEKILHKVLRGTIQSMHDLSTELNPNESGGIDMDVNGFWLKSMILKAKKSDAKIIFNVCLLPDRNIESGRSQFNPLIYKSATNYYNIDHLIPDSSNFVDNGLRGKTEIQSIINFAPLETEKNQAASATPCSLKLTTSGIYDTVSQRHPYCNWLVKTHCPQIMASPPVYPSTGKSNLGSPGEKESSKKPLLDSQVNLLEADPSEISSKRVAQLIKILTVKL